MPVVECSWLIRVPCATVRACAARVAEAEGTASSTVSSTHSFHGSKPIQPDGRPDPHHD